MLEGASETVSTPFTVILEAMLKIILMPLNLLKDSFFMDIFIGILEFFVLFNVVSLLIIEMFIIGLTLIHSKSKEDDIYEATFDPFILVHRYVMYHVEFVRALGSFFKWFIDVIHEIINTLIPV